MVRTILAAVVGYIALVIVVLTGIFIAWSILGGTGAFRGEGPEPSTLWLVLNLVVAFTAAFVGGCVALKIGKSSAAVKILVGIVIVLGIYVALTAESAHADREPVDKLVAEMSFWEAGQHARQPVWYNWVVPLIGVAGVMLGGRQKT